jgi:hypothetical protein
MPTAPAITLTATLDDLTGAAAGSTANAAKLRISLCGFGPVLPKIAGTAMLARVGPFDFYSSGAQISTLIFGNDQITPPGTYYSIEILDGEDNVVQCGAYSLTGAGTQDLSNLAQIVPPFGFLLGGLVMAGTDSPNPATKIAGAIPGTVYTAPGNVVMVFYNGVQQRPGIDYNAVGNTITLTFSTALGDNVYALCVV